MDTLQFLHFPSKKSHDRTGMLSMGRIVLLQLGQAEAGETTERSSGILAIQTFMKLPRHSPNRSAKISNAMYATYSLLRLVSRSRIRSVS